MRFMLNYTILWRNRISNLLDRGVDLSTAAKVAGHASTDTTARYDRRGERALRAAGEALGELPQ
jgi:site-specific recombinase XerD